jgi:predicted nucleic acid-binding protein
MIVVADTGPLLALAKIGALDLLHELYQEVITGPTVYTEAVTVGLAINAPDAATLEQAYQRGELVIHTPTLPALSHPALLQAGEAEGIRLAIELQADWLLVDDLDARQAARENFTAAGVSTSVKGTLGVIVSAVMAQLRSPEQAIELIKTLKSRPDIWLAPSLCDKVIQTLQRLV